MDKLGSIVLRVNRPFSFINSRISISKGEDLPSPSNKIGECQQIWHPYRRKYALFQRFHSEELSTTPAPNSQSTEVTTLQGSTAESYTQFANVDARLLAWDFYLQDEHGQILASVNRNFMGFGRELFTDTGQYVLRFDKGVADQEVQERIEQGVGINEELKKVAEENKEAKLEHERKETQSTAIVPVPDISEAGLTLDQRAILLAAAITIDIDYFSRHGGGG